MIWLQFFIAFATLLGALVIFRHELHAEERRKGWTLHVLVPAVLVITTAASCILIYLQDADAKEAKAEAARALAQAAAEVTQAKNQLDRIEGRMGSDEMAKRYLTTMRRITQEYASATTAAAVDRFFDTAGQREQLRVDEALANEKARLEFSLQIDPIIELIASKVDAWVAGVERNGIKISVTKGAQETATVGLPQRHAVLRGLTFQDGSRMEVQLYPAVIEGGKVVQNMHIQAPFFMKSGGGYEVWILDSIGTTTAVYVRNPRPERISFRQFDSREPNPGGEVDLLRAVSQSLDAAMAFVVNEAAGTSRKVAEKPQ